MAFLDRIPMSTVIIAALLLGLAPFVPEPHVLEKLRLLVAGELVKPIDIGDLLFHGAPWLLLFAKLARRTSGKG